MDFLVREKHMRVWDTRIVLLAAYFSPRNHLWVSNIMHASSCEGHVEEREQTRACLWTLKELRMDHLN